MKKSSLPLTEELDFSYLLGLMRPLHNIDEFSLLPELFTLLGHEKVIELCRYVGGETITFPTLEELSDSVEALQIFYDVYIAKKYKLDDVENTANLELVKKIKEIYDVRECEEANK